MNKTYKNYFNQWDIQRRGETEFIVSHRNGMVLSWFGKSVMDASSATRPFASILSKKERLIVAEELEAEMRRRLMLPPEVEDEPTPWYLEPSSWAGIGVLVMVLVIVAFAVL